MSMTERLASEFQAITKEYDQNFAGQSRYTRDVSLIEGLAKKVRSLVSEIDQIPEPARDARMKALYDDASRTADVYTREREAIVEAKAAGPQFEPFSALATWANFAFARYFRHFAGQSRQSRDALLLEELREELERVQAEMKRLAGTPPNPAFERDIKLVTDTLNTYRLEGEAVSTAQTGGSPLDVAQRLGVIANNQFALYRANFAGSSRITRRPALLVRMIDTLEIVHDRMLRTGINESFHQQNIQVVESQLQLFRSELEEIRAARKAVPLADLMGFLGGDANQLFEDYRNAFAGKDRRRVDREKLGQICDKLFELAKQMDDLRKVEANESNERNLEIVTTQLAQFETEYAEVTNAQAPTPSTT